MKIKKILAITLTLSLMLVSLTACGNPVKNDFKEYVNKNVITTFLPENNEIINDYTVAMKSADVKTMVDALSKTLPKKNDALLEKMKAYSPQTTEVQELHNIYINAAEIRKEAYVLMLGALTTNASDESAADTAIAKLTDSDNKFVEFQTKLDSMKKDLGLVDVKK